MGWAIGVMPRGQILVDKCLQGLEVEVDAISDGETVVIPGVMQHVERAGVHSGDSYAVYPAPGLERRELDHIVDYTVRIARHLFFSSRRRHTSSLCDWSSDVCSSD